MLTCPQELVETRAIVYRDDGDPRYHKCTARIFFVVLPNVFISVHGHVTTGGNCFTFVFRLVNEQVRNKNCER